MYVHDTNPYTHKYIALILAVYTIFWLNHIYRDGSRKLPNPVAIVPLVIMLIVMLLAMLPHNHSAVLTHVQNAFSEQECR